MVGYICFISIFFWKNMVAILLIIWKKKSLVFVSGLCALIGLCIFTVNRGVGNQFNLADDKFFVDYWDDIEETVEINDGDVEIWLRYSYIVGWFGVAFTCFALITAFFSDLTREQYRPIITRFWKTGYYHITHDSWFARKKKMILDSTLDKLFWIVDMKKLHLNIE